MSEHHQHHDCHEHGDNCTCGHDHHHMPVNLGEETGQEAAPVPGEIHVESHLHDEARVISGQVTVSAEYDKLKSVLTDALAALAKAVGDRDGIIGHIKASCEVRQVEMFSVTDTDAEVAVKSVPSQDIRIKLAAIVFFISPEEAETLVRGSLEAVCAGV